MGREVYGGDCRAAAAVQEEYPGQQIYVMDTRCISGGLGMLVENVVRRKEEGMSFREAIAWGEHRRGGDV